MSSLGPPATSGSAGDPTAALRAGLTEQVQAYQASVDAFDEAAARWLRVTRTDLRCLEILARDGAATPATLGPALGLTSGGVTAMLIRLERDEFLRRVPDPADRRRVTVEVTDRTLEFAELFYGPIALEGAGLISDYSAADLRLLAGFFRAARELQERHLARVQDLPRPVDLSS
jgi:DNA-binding MarR family transcriptional regulator